MRVKIFSRFLTIILQLSDTWFTGCKPCVAELSKLNELNDAIKSMGGGIDNKDNYDALMKQIQSVIDADSTNK